MNLIPVFVVTMCVGLVYGQSSSCVTPDGVSGECIQISQCAPILTLINNPKKTDRDLIQLSKSHCGIQEGVQKVCCPKESKPVYSLNGPCSTPDGKPGTCVSLNSCPHLRNMLRPPVAQVTINFVKNSICNSPEPRTVCCDSHPEEVQLGDCQTKMTAFPPDPSSECCGDSAGFGNKIWGGNTTAIDEYPWAVIIEYTNKKYATIGLYCGGALISGKYVLTAAHCIAGPILDKATPNLVRLGEYDITNEGLDCVTAAGGGTDCTEGVSKIAIERTIPHPKYSPGKSKRDDIGLIRLKETARYTDFIRPVCLPTKDLTRPENTPAHFSMYAVGWGATETSSTHSNVKLDVNVPFVSMEKCQPTYDRAGRNLSLWRSQLCAGGIEGQDTCKGDSGGPLVYEYLGKFELIGIVSFGPSPCGEKGVPGVYSNVYEYLDWIKSVIVP